MSYELTADMVGKRVIANNEVTMSYIQLEDVSQMDLLASSSSKLTPQSGNGTKSAMSQDFTAESRQYFVKYKGRNEVSLCNVLPL